ncbi:LacI family DNA-binding transcriptional regulator [Ramlibacter sp.]|uniref:LacI family DNA-binding transcriptional regulator n=1 Tax=Ramlibacter sp. TaxID=1917967 RepID=UPI002B516ABE|nr:LacI family DNA-binding transcriptional regulator [Ramlibacter sp.]HWI80566.1 LacI family DNA-binding transcriptional regulator [Ramlibacter sp.]
MPAPPPATRTRTAAKDVALLAGVSTATVSRALNTPEHVDPATLQRVREAMAKLRYVPHGVARSLRSQRSRMIGAIVPSFDYALYARTTSALQQLLSAHGYAVVLAEHDYDLGQELQVTRHLIEHGVDAFVFVGVEHDPRLYALLEDYGRPFVLTWGVDAARRWPCIGFDNRAAGYQMARHLLQLGHRRFGMISAPTEGNDRGRERGLGIRAALTEAGLSLPDSQVQYARITLAAAQEAMERLLALPQPPTAVLATNDVLAVGAMMACRAAGVRVPQDVSITGVDNTDLGATQTPGLTSVRTPIVEIGRAAAEQLIARLDGREFVANQSLPFDLVFRGSTAAPRARV